MAIKTKLFMVPELPSKVLLKFLPFSHKGMVVLREFFVGDWREFNQEHQGWEMELVILEKLRRIFDAEGTLEYDDEVARQLRIIDSHKRGDGIAAPAPMEFTDYKFKTVPYDHQRMAFHLGRNRKFYALLFEMGAGKTKTAIDLISYWAGRGETEGALIITKKSMLYTWEREIAMHSPLAPEKRRTVVFDGNAKDKLDALSMGANTAAFFVATYDTVRILENEFVRLLRRRNLAIAADESTQIKHHVSKRAKVVVGLRTLATHRLILTGSPIGNLPLDAFMQFYFLDPNILGHSSFTSFKSEYAIILKDKRLANGAPHPLNNKLITGFRNLERLGAKIKPHSYRVLKKDCLDLPEKVYRTVELEMGTQQRDYYEQMKKDSVIWFENLKNPCNCSPAENVADHNPMCASLQPVTLVASHILVRTTRLAQLTGGFYPILGPDNKPVDMAYFEDNPKLDAVMEALEEAIEAGHKVIIWCRFLPEIRALIKRLSGLKIDGVEIGTAVLTGDTDAYERDMRIRGFQELPEVKVFLGQIQAGGVGITLTAASKVLYYSNALSLEDRLQSEDRAHRIGQRNDVEYIDFSYRRTVDMTIVKALKAKKSFADIITGDNIRRAYDGELDVA